MIFHLITLFPEVFPPILNSSILKRAQKNKLVSFNYINPRDLTTDNYHTVDDKPYGGGPGMVMKVEPIAQAIESIKSKPYVILTSASGKQFNQKIAKALCKKREIAIICGHYEGVDARVEKYVDEVISVGNYVLTGGEIPALIIIDAITRLIPGAIRKTSPQDESFSGNSLEYPQYTRPETFKGTKVPKVLLSGNHKEIEKWRKEQSLKRTRKYNPKLLK